MTDTEIALCAAEASMEPVTFTVGPLPPRKLTGAFVLAWRDPSPFVLHDVLDFIHEMNVQRTDLADTRVRVAAGDWWRFREALSDHPALLVTVSDDGSEVRVLGLTFVWDESLSSGWLAQVRVEVRQVPR